MRAIWQQTVIAESDDTVVVEGNHYFPASALRRDCFAPSDERSHCPWKGDAHYYDIVINGRRNAAAAWYYPAPMPAASDIAGRVAFWRGVVIEP